MGKRFDNQVTIPAGTPTQILPLMIAKGFTEMPMCGLFSITFDSDVYVGNSSAVSPTNGRLQKGGVSLVEDTSDCAIVDLTQFWVFTTGGATAQIFTRPK